jgi:hypothetical protein
MSLHNKLIKSISTQVLILAEQHQKGRVDKNSTSVDFDFTEGSRAGGATDVAIFATWGKVTRFSILGFVYQWVV